jgi:hypothetical protein
MVLVPRAVRDNGAPQHARGIRHFNNYLLRNTVAAWHDLRNRFGSPLGGFRSSLCLQGHSLGGIFLMEAKVCDRSRHKAVR